MQRATAYRLSGGRTQLGIDGALRAYDVFRYMRRLERYALVGGGRACDAQGQSRG